MTKLAGVVLCGGASRRMGVAKTAIRVDGRLLVERVAEKLASIADPVLIAAGGRQLPDLPFERIADARRDAGPLAGIVAALRATDRPLAVVAGDMTNVDPSLLRFLADLQDGDLDAVVPVDDHGLQPLHAVYAPSALTALESALNGDDLSLRSALGRLRVRTVEREEWGIVEPSGRFAANVNTPADLAELS